jgi:hypothetical protein
MMDSVAEVCGAVTGGRREKQSSEKVKESKWAKVQE